MFIIFEILSFDSSLRMNEGKNDIVLESIAALDMISFDLHRLFLYVILYS